ncbi:hypothetical protein C8Q74DRAFT_381810 [Fomes fomentarius]|nr:hypothetical protein C8Q74DRAFT_381810 [Fomes fomentarius]
MQQPAFFSPGLASYGFDALGLPMSQSSLGSSQTDLNSPELFRQNMQLAQGLIVRVQALAQSALAGTQHAYQPGTNPVQTAADIVNLKQTLLELVELLRSSGVGALPLEIPPIVPDPRAENALIEEESRVVQALFDRQKRLQEGAGVVAGYLTFSGVGRGE